MQIASFACYFFFFQAEDGIRDIGVTGVQTCALPIFWLIGAAYLSAQFTGVPTAVWIIAFILVTSALNLIGIRVNARANYLLVAFQLLVLGIFVALSIAYFVREDTSASLLSPFFNENLTVAALAAGAAVAAYSFIG